MINKLGLQNFKGISRVIDFAKLNVITGENFAGKTAIFQAITVASLGHLPALGKTNPATFKLSSDRTMAVDMEATSGRVTRAWKQSGKSIKGTTDGDAPGFRPFDAEAFLAAKPGDRLAMLGAGSMAAMDDLQAHLVDICRRVNIKTEGETPIERAEFLAEAIKEKVTEANARKLQFEKTLLGLVELAASAPPAPILPPDPAPALAAARAKVTAANQAVGNAENAVDMAQEAARERELLMIAGPVVQPEDYSKTAENHQRASKSLAEVNQRIANLKGEKASLARDLSAPPYDAARLEELEALAKEKDWGKEATEDRQEMAAWNLALQSARSNVANLKNELAAADSWKCCPTCQASATGWKDAVRATLQAALAKEEAKELEAVNKATHEADRLTISEGKLKAIRDELPRLQAARLLADKAAISAKRTLAINTELEGLEQHAESFGAELAGLWESLRTNQEQANRWQTFELLTAAAAKYAAAYEAQQAAYEAEQGAAMELENAEAAAEAYQVATMARAQFAASEQNLINARKEAEAEAEKVEALKADAAKLKGTLETELKKLFGKVQTLANGFSAGILPSALDLHPTTAQIGRYDGTTWIPFEIMSGTEQLVATAALQAGLAAAGSGVLMLDEMARMRLPVKMRLIGKIENALAAGLIKQAIVIDHTAGPEYSEWQAITA